MSQADVYQANARGNYINGKFMQPPASEGEIQSVSPADLKDMLGRFQYATGHVDEAVASAKAAFPKWRSLPTEDRANYLKKLQQEFTKRKENIAEVLAREVGKPLWEARTEAGALVGKIAISLVEGAQQVNPTVYENLLPSTNGYCRFKPLGVLSVFGPFNFPAHLPNGHITPALLAGNVVIFKPSEKTPLVGQVLAECFDVAGFPPGVFNLIQGERSVGEKLAGHPEVRGVLFTGSYDVGLAIKRATLDQPGKMLALEMGGKNSAIVCEDAPLDQALLETLTGAFLTTGQRCSATSKILIHESLVEAFRDRFVKMTKTLRVGYPLSDVFMGSLIDAKSVERYISAVALSENEAIQLLAPGERLTLEKEGYYVSPSVGMAKGWGIEKFKKSPFFQEEIFGPNVTLIPFSDLDFAIQVANATDYGLVSSVFTREAKTYEYCWEQLDTGLINWNKSTVGASSKLPFGGLKKSGNYFPTALFASRYCTVPVTSMEMPNPPKVENKYPGLTWQ